MSNTVRRIGKAAGVLAPNETYAREYLRAGANFVAVGTDVGLMSAAAQKLLITYRNVADEDAKTGSTDYRQMAQCSVL
jgi:4-hydroxy-2-oxoheptanedioate aldolase